MDYSHRVFKILLFFITDFHSSFLFIWQISNKITFFYSSLFFFIIKSFLCLFLTVFFFYLSLVIWLYFIHVDHNAMVLKLQFSSMKYLFTTFYGYWRLICVCVCFLMVFLKWTNLQQNFQSYHTSSAKVQDRLKKST